MYPWLPAARQAADSTMSLQLDPIAAYDRCAPRFYLLAQRRQRYLDSVDELILQRLPPAPRSLLDVGAGDGRRGFRIAQLAGVREVVLVEPSSGMRRLIPQPAEIWPQTIEELPISDRRFDVVLCLWNVLGHIPTDALRRQTLCRLGQLCSTSGLIFLDVVNRYNLRECGPFRVVGRMLRDALSRQSAGDVSVRWNLGEEEVKTWGHVFTLTEMSRLIEGSGLRLVERLVVDYKIGELRQSPCAGNFFYVLAKSALPTRSSTPGESA